MPCYNQKSFCWLVGSMPFSVNLDIDTALQVLFFLSILGAVLAVLSGFQSIRAGSRLMFFRKRQEMIMRGWRNVVLGAILGAVAYSLNNYAEPAIYRVFPPSPTITLTPTVTRTPTISLTPTITLSPTITTTPLFSPTPVLPENYAEKFQSEVTPSVDAIFSSLQFSQKIEGNLPVDPVTEFKNPVSHLYGTFSYDKMVDGSQWTALWMRDKEIVCEETKPWDGGSGGYGYTDCLLPGDEWLPGDYEVQVFLGTNYITGGTFVLQGNAPTATRTPLPTKTPAPTITRMPSATLIPTQTPYVRLTDTRQPTATIKSMSNTAQATITRQITLEPDVRVVTATGTPVSGLIP